MRTLFPALLIAMSLSVCGADSQPLPDATNVVQRLIERARAVARDTNRLTYEKISVVAELDEAEKTVKSTEKHYRVLQVGGLTFQRLTQIKGRALTAAELEKQNQREAAFRQRVSRVDVNRKARRKEALITQDLADRFQFQVLRREQTNGRPTLVLSFKARADLAENTIEDKVFRQVAGTLWVDEEEAELVKLDASLRNAVPLGWFGAVGSLTKFHAVIERVRTPEGVWAIRRNSFFVIARKVLSTIRTRTTEECSGHRRDDAL
jgi:hypothetical protein